MVGLRTTVRQVMRDGAVIAVAMGVMNLTTYGFTILAARLLGPAEYGALAAVMGLLLVVNVLSLGLQATGARRVSAAPERPAGRSSARCWRPATRSALALGLLVLLASPGHRLPAQPRLLAAAALIAATRRAADRDGRAGRHPAGRAPLGPAGRDLPRRRARPASASAPLALLVEPNTLGAMVGVTVGAFVPVLIGWRALRHPDRRARPDAHAAAPPQPRWARGGVLRETVHNSHALLAFFALSNADVIIARITLDEHQAGLYAGGLILTKAVLFLPQFVVVIAFPSMSQPGADRRMHLLSLALVLGIGVVTVAGRRRAVAASRSCSSAARSTPSSQAGCGRSRLLGTLLAMLQLMVYDIVARQRQRAVLLVWAALRAAVRCAIPFVDSLTAC